MKVEKIKIELSVEELDILDFALVELIDSPNFRDVEICKLAENLLKKIREM